ncbi:MAG: hypothetical protein CO099_06115 [Bdellovibrio sp. CG_4_9_14_3_um_filter_39_7]|nr:MAG: hypothetical protein CO099_06115 [Bdellovibrio sp. CG_4_9_14_3_um_filter_39_7]
MSENKIETDLQGLSLCKKHRGELIYLCSPCCQFCLHEEKSEYLLRYLNLEKERDELKETLEKLIAAISIFDRSVVLAISKPNTIDWKENK